MRPKICIPIVASMRDVIMSEAGKIAKMPVQMAEWRIDFYAGYEQEIESIIIELKKVLADKELIVTLRTESEGGEPNGSRFDYFALLERILRQGMADYVDVEVERDAVRTTELLARYKKNSTKVIGSYHDFDKTPSEKFILDELTKAKKCGCDVGKLACMPQEDSDADIVFRATAKMKELYPDYPLITMSMGQMGEKTRLYGGLYGSEVSFGCDGHISAPGQISYKRMNEIFDYIYSGKRHIILIGFMGTGKSTISRELSKQSGWPELDTDSMIVEQEKKSIADIFADDGETYFRNVETAIIDQTSQYEHAIISCGGGMALRELNVRKLQALGEVVLLTAKPETIYERVRHSKTRPILNGNMNVEFITELMNKRNPFYQKASTLQISTDNKSAYNIAKEILEKCRQI